MRLVSRIEEVFGQRWSPAVVHEHPTVAALAALLSDLTERSDILVRFREGASSVPVVCVQVGGGHSLYYRWLAQQLTEHTVVGVHPPGLQGGPTDGTYPNLAASYARELFRNFGDGPLHLVGYCMGASLALELASQWRREGRPVRSLTIIDSGVKFGSLYPDLNYHLRMQESTVVGVAMYAKAWLRRIREGSRAAMENFQLRRSDDAADRREYFRRRVEWICRKAFHAHHPPIVDVPIRLIRSSQHASAPDKDFHLDWQEHTTQVFSVTQIEADHDQLLLEPKVAPLAAAVRETLAWAE